MEKILKGIENFRELKAPANQLGMSRHYTAQIVVLSWIVRQVNQYIETLEDQLRECEDI